MMSQFVVKYEIEDEVHVAVETAYHIFDRMDLDDCYHIRILDIREFNTDHFCEPCEFFGTWHNFDEPLRMEIRRKADGVIVAVGYGTDH